MAVSVLLFMIYYHFSTSLFFSILIFNGFISLQFIDIIICLLSSLFTEVRIISSF